VGKSIRVLSPSTLPGSLVLLRAVQTDATILLRYTIFWFLNLLHTVECRCTPITGRTTLNDHV
jgi:hypothetical protein